jgi:hypothetical protein
MSICPTHKLRTVWKETTSQKNRGTYDHVSSWNAGVDSTGAYATKATTANSVNTSAGSECSDNPGMYHVT